MAGYSTKKKAELISLLASPSTSPAAAPASAEPVPATPASAEPAPAIETVPCANILAASHWKNTNAFKAMKEKETQFKYYTRMNSCEEVLQLVSLDSKPFGGECENIIKELFQLGPRTSSQNDGTRHGKKIEIKCARYWAGSDDCKWQHLEQDHDYEIAMFGLLDFHGWKIWAIKKSTLMGECREKKVVTFQGKQGWWANKSALLPYLTPLASIADLDAFILPKPDAS